MPLPSLFIASSSESKQIAEAMKLHLSPVAKVEVWYDDQFSINKGFLDELLRLAKINAFCVAIASSDDRVKSRGITRWGTRDNVLFEFGLFMGNLGENRTFFVHADNITIPSDLVGVTLLSFNHLLARRNPLTALLQVAARIKKAIRILNENAFVGKWKSIYLFPYDSVPRLQFESAEISLVPHKLRIKTWKNDKRDPYEGHGTLIQNRHLVGDWRSTRPGAPAFGSFMLTLSNDGDLMYGIFAGGSRTNQMLHGEWVLVRDSVKNVKQALQTGLEMLGDTLGNFMKAKLDEVDIPADAITKARKSKQKRPTRTPGTVKKAGLSIRPQTVRPSQ